MKTVGITSNMFTNQYDSAVRITALVHETGSNQVKIFSSELSVVSGQLSLSLDPLLGKTRAINDIMERRGSLAGSTSGEVQLATKEATITLKKDMVYLTDQKGIEQSGNIIQAMLNGEGFMFNGKYQKVIGSNGTYKRGAKTHQNNIFKKLFELDGMLSIHEAEEETTGAKLLTKNVRTPAYDKTCNYIIFEVIEKFDESNIEGLRFVYTMNNNVQWSDATDANEVSFTQVQLCDYRSVTNFIVEGYSDAEVGADIPARRVRLHKTPVSIFKANVSMGSGDIDTKLGLLTAGTDFTIPGKLISLGADGDYIAEDYTPELGDVATLYITDTDTAFSNHGYAIAVMSTLPTYSLTKDVYTSGGLAGESTVTTTLSDATYNLVAMYADNTVELFSATVASGTATRASGTFAKDVASLAVNLGYVSGGTAGSDSFLVLGNVTGDIAVGDKLVVSNAARTSTQTVTVDAIYYDGSTNTTIDTLENLEFALGAGSIIGEVTEITPTGFQLIKSDYTLSEAEAFGTGTLANSAKATTLAEALIPIYDFNFEDLTFDQL